MKTRSSELILLIGCSLLVGGSLAFLNQRLGFSRRVTQRSSQTTRPKSPAPIDSNAELEQLGLHLQMAIRNRQTAVCRTLTSDKMFQLRVNNRIPDAERRVSLRQARSILDRFWISIFDELPRRQVRFESLGPRRFQDQAVICFRRTSRDSMIDYYFLAVERDESRELRVADIFALSEGKWNSDVIQEAAQAVDYSADYDGFHESRRRRLEVKRLVRRLLQHRNYQEADRVLEQLPSVAWADADFAYLRWSTAHKLGRSRFLTVMDSMWPLLPPTAQLVAGVFYHEAKGEIDEALVKLTKLEALLGGDAYLNYHRARLLLASRETQAVKLLDAVVKKYEESAEAHRTLLEVWNRRRDFAKTQQVLLLMEQRFRFDLEPLLERTDFAWFVADARYRTFIGERHKLLAERRAHRNARDTRLLNRHDVRFRQ